MCTLSGQLRFLSPFPLDAESGSPDTWTALLGKRPSSQSGGDKVIVIYVLSIPAMTDSDSWDDEPTISVTEHAALDALNKEGVAILKSRIANGDWCACGKWGSPEGFMSPWYTLNADFQSTSAHKIDCFCPIFFVNRVRNILLHNSMKCTFDLYWNREKHREKHQNLSRGYRDDSRHYVSIKTKQPHIRSWHHSACLSLSLF